MAGSRVNDILVFLSVVEKGSFSAGGLAFGLSRSTAGKAVSRLEESYGARLLNRTTRSIDLTDEGRQLYAHGVKIRDAIEATDDALRTTDGKPSGTLRITAPDAIGRRRVLPAVQLFLQRWPMMKVQLNLSDRIDNLVDGGFDLAIRLGVTQPDSSFISRTLWKENIVLCASPDYLDRNDRPGTLEEMTRHDLLRFSTAATSQGWLLPDENGQQQRVMGRVRLSLDSGEALLEAALAGGGIALLPQTLVQKGLDEGKLERLLPQIDCGTVPVVALYPHKRLLEPRVTRFLELLLEHRR